MKCFVFLSDRAHAKPTLVCSGDHDQTDEVLQNGWYRTGDMGYIDRHGFISITDRLSRFSKIAGEMVPHIKVEEAIHDLLEVSETQAVVTSVDDEQKGERLVVLHKKGLDSQDMVRMLRKTDIPNLWIPDVCYFFPIDEFPVLGTGKLDLSQIKNLANDYFEVSKQSK